MRRLHRSWRRSPRRQPTEVQDTVLPTPVHDTDLAANVSPSTVAVDAIVRQVSASTLNKEAPAVNPANPTQAAPASEKNPDLDMILKVNDSSVKSPAAQAGLVRLEAIRAALNELDAQAAIRAQVAAFHEAPVSKSAGAQSAVSLAAGRQRKYRHRRHRFKPTKHVRMSPPLWRRWCRVPRADSFRSGPASLYGPQCSSPRPREEPMRQSVSSSNHVGRLQFRPLQISLRLRRCSECGDKLGPGHDDAGHQGGL